MAAREGQTPHWHHVHLDGLGFDLRTCGWGDLLLGQQHLWPARRWDDAPVADAHRGVHVTSRFVVRPDALPLGQSRYPHGMGVLRRRVIRQLWCIIVGSLALGIACQSNGSLEAGAYDRSCTSDADCVTIAVGTAVQVCCGPDARPRRSTKGRQAAIRATRRASADRGRAGALRAHHARSLQRCAVRAHVSRVPPAPRRLATMPPSSIRVRRGASL